MSRSPIVSDWNLYLERKLKLNLTPNESRLADALARLLLGYRQREDRLGRRIIQQTSRIDDMRTLYRARDGLIEKGLLEYEVGRKGGGGASLYRLRLPDDVAVARHSDVAAARHTPKPSECRSGGSLNVAVARQGIGSKGKTARPAAGEKNEKTFQARVIDEYLSHGGSLELDAWKGALLRSATALQKAGASDRVLFAAVRELGREGAFPGYLKQRAEGIEANGGPCSWQGMDRSALTVKQLSECPCPHCEKWAAHRKANG